MDFALNGEQKIIQETIKDFVSKECPRELARELEENSILPKELLGKIAALGFCGLTVPEDYGGEGVNFLSAVIAIEELSSVSPALAMAYMSPSFTGGAIIAKLGSAEQKEQFLEPLVRGDSFFTIALAETEAGYNFNQQVSTEAALDGDGFRINGKKLFVSFADQAEYCLTLAKNKRPDSEKEDYTIFIVDLNSPGITINSMDKIGMKGSGSKEVVFENVFVASKYILGGKEGLYHGLKQLDHVIDLQNLGTSACCLGISQGAYGYARQHARERIQFDHPIISFEAIQFMLVDIAVQIDALRLLLYQAVVNADQGISFSQQINTAMVYGLDLVQKAAMQAMQVCGGYGYAMEYDAQRYLRDSFSIPLTGLSRSYFKKRLGSLLLDGH